MKLTKYIHSCLVLEEQGTKLIVDPGEWTAEFGDTANVAAVVITHVHGDHFEPKNLEKIVAANPEVKVFTTKEAAEKWGDSHAQAVTAGETQTVGPFTLEFFGELHKAVHPEWQPAQNIGVLVNGTLYYPGDSFTEPGKPVTTLALPTSAPWLRMGEAIDFLKAVNPTQFFRTHDGLWNENGITTTNNWLNNASEKFGPKYLPLEPDGSIEI